MTIRTPSRKQTELTFKLKECHIHYQYSQRPNARQAIGIATQWHNSTLAGTLTPNSNFFREQAKCETGMFWWTARRWQASTRLLSSPPEMVKRMVLEPQLGAQHNSCDARKITTLWDSHTEWVWLHVAIRSGSVRDV